METTINPHFAILDILIIAEGNQEIPGEDPFRAVRVTAFECFVIIDMVI